MINNFVTQNIFFHSSTNIKASNFFNYSKTREDIYFKSYVVRRQQISNRFKSNEFFTIEDLSFNDQDSELDFKNKLYNIKNFPYELFIKSP